MSISFKLIGQECDCLKNIKLLQQKVEENQASYQHQVIEQQRIDDYTIHKSKINNQAVKILTKKDCIGLVSLYLSFFRDEHCFISYSDNYTPQSNISVISKRKRSDDTILFEGLWYFQDGSFSINVIPAKSTFGKWVAVIDKDKSKSWKKGQLKIEFINKLDGSFDCIYWSKNLIPKSYKVSLTDSTLIIGRKLIFYRKTQVVQNNTNNTNDFQFRKLSEQTNYLKIPSFDLSFKNKIDSLMTINQLEITSKKNLIIDIRNNGGGGFDAFQSILPFILDTNLVETPYYGSVWVSKDNFEYYDNTKYEYAESKQDSISELKYVEHLKNYLNHFTPIEKTIDTVQLEKNSPLNIAIIFNKNTASSAEGFLLQASTSKKVKTYGENSSGAVSYGDWMPVDLPELNINVAITTKKMIFKNNEDFESIGILPDINLSNINENEWLELILKQMEKK